MNSTTKPDATQSAGTKIDASFRWAHVSAARSLFTMTDKALYRVDRNGQVVKLCDMPGAYGVPS